MHPSAKTLKISRSFQKNKVSSAIFLKPISTWHHVCLYQQNSYRTDQQKPWINHDLPLCQPPGLSFSGPMILRVQQMDSRKFPFLRKQPSSNGKSKHKKTGQFGKQKQNNPGFVEGVFLPGFQTKKNPTIFGFKFLSPKKW